MRIGIYPGSFDPITNGHLDIIERGRKLFDKLYIVLSVNPNKKTHSKVCRIFLLRLLFNKIRRSS